MTCSGCDRLNSIPTSHTPATTPPALFPRKSTPSFPQKRESNPIIRHSREGGNQTPSSVIPAKAGIHNSRACGNSSSHYPNARKNTPSFPRMRESNPIIRHSRKGGNQTPSSVIPAKAGIHNSRACGNSSSHYPNARKNTPPFPRMRESNPIIRHSRKGGNPTPSSVIPAKAGIHNSRACGNSTKRNTIQTDQTPHPHTGLPQRHSRFRGNAGVFFFGHWGKRTMNSRLRGNCGFPPSRE